MFIFVYLEFFYYVQGTQKKYIRNLKLTQSADAHQGQNSIKFYYMLVNN